MPFICCAIAMVDIVPLILRYARDRTRHADAAEDCSVFGMAGQLLRQRCYITVTDGRAIISKIESIEAAFRSRAADYAARLSASSRTAIAFDEALSSLS